MNSLKKNLNTGDLLLVTQSTTGIFGMFLSLIKWGTHSNFTHIAMILKNPSFIHPSLKGTFVWESSWEGKPDPQDGQIKLGVQITPLSEFLESYKNTGHIYLRKILAPKSTFNNKKLSKIHNVVYDKPYDLVPTDWIQALVQKDSHPQKTSRFWCSALIGYIYTQCGILNKNTDWTILRPSDFSLVAKILILLTDSYYNQLKNEFNNYLNKLYLYYILTISSL